jgi:hypothetical protein
MNRLAKEIGGTLCGRTIERWRRWWHRILPGTEFWRKSRARFSMPIATDRLPGSLLERFSGGDLDRMLQMLTFLSPLTSASAPDPA